MLLQWSLGDSEAVDQNGPPGEGRISDMRSLVIYESMFGNTEQVARAIAAGLSTHMEVDVVPVSRACTDVSSAYDLIVVGGPTHAFSMSRPSTRKDAQSQGAPTRPIDVGIREWLDALPKQRYTGVAAAFDTRVGRVRHLPGSAAKRASKVLRRHGLSVLESPQSFYVHDTDGPLIDGELSRAETWGELLAHDVMAADPRVRRP
jgi:hypothetical protein